MILVSVTYDKEYKGSILRRYIKNTDRVSKLLKKDRLEKTHEGIIEIPTFGSVENFRITPSDELRIK